MEVSCSGSDNETDGVQKPTLPSLDKDMDSNGDPSGKTNPSNSLPGDMPQVMEAVFVCQTIQTNVVNEKEFDLQIHIEIETSDLTPLFVNLLKKGIIQCKRSVGRVNKKSGSCKGCRKNVTETDGEISMIFEVSDESKCDDCLPLARIKQDKTQRFERGELHDDEKIVLKETSGKSQSTRKSSSRSKRGSTRKQRPPVKLRLNKTTNADQSEDNGEDEGEAEEGEHDLKLVGKDKTRSSRRRTSKTLTSVTNETESVLMQDNVTTCVKAVTKDSTEVVVGPLFKQVTWKTKKSSKSMRMKYECNVCGVSYSGKARMLKHVKIHGGKGETTENYNVVRNDSKLQREKVMQRKISAEGNRTVEESVGTLESDVKSEIAKKDEDVSEEEEDNHKFQKRIRPRRISSVRPHKCSVCGRSYQLLKTLKSHERSHSEVFDYECQVCRKGFHLPSRLKYHMRIHTGERPFQCTVCGSSFVKNGHLTHHMKTHSTERPYKCSVCGKGFTEACYLKVHERNHTGEKPYQCDKCGKCFTNSSSFHFHQRIHNSEIFKCQMCDKTFQTEKTLQQHNGVHTGVRPFICDFCGKGCMTLSRLNRHKRTHSLDRPHKCPVCNKGFHDQSDLRVHARTHSGEKPYNCDVCNKKFALKESLNRHSLVHSENRPHKCDECGKTYASIRQLRKHMMIHTGAKEFICEQCGKCFLTSSSLRSHNQTHAGYRPHKCDICGRTYRSSWYLQVHRKTHTGENLIQCHTCGDWFINPSYFKLHQQKHCKGKLLYCSICNRGFSHNHALQSHMGLHTGERPYGCDMCGKAFVKPALLQDHIKRHSEENVHKCSVCGKGFKRTNDRKKHEIRHARKMRKLNLPDRLKPGHKDNMAIVQEKDILQQAAESIRDVEGGAGIVMEDECSEIETPQVVTEQVVLTTIDSSQIAEQQSSTIQMSESDKNVIQEQIIVSVDHPYFSDHTIAVPSHTIPSSSGVHVHTLNPGTMFHTTTQAAIPVVSSHQMAGQHGLVGEPRRIQTLTPLQPTSVQMSSQPGGHQPHTDQHLPITIGQNPPLTHPLPTHSWMY